MVSKIDKIMKLKKRKNLWYNAELQWNSDDELSIEYEGKQYVLRVRSDSDSGVDTWEGVGAVNKRRINKLDEDQKQEICDFLEFLIDNEFTMKTYPKQ